MKVFITGINGFVGQHLADELAAHGHLVSGVDLVPPAVGVARHPWHEGDIASPGCVEAGLVVERPDVVVHLAAQVGREFGEDDILRTIRWNASGTALVARAAGAYRTRVLYTSTSEIYGDLGPDVAHEHGPKRLPHNLYGLSKRWGEEALALYAPHGLMVARLSMPYGPGAPPGRGRRAMDNFLWQAIHGRPIPVHRGAERSWCWVGDTVRALRYMLEAGRGGVWNVGRDDDRRSMRAIAEMACDLAGAPRDLIQEVDPPGAQTVVKRLSTAQVREDFSWEPTVELEEGMRLVYDWILNFDADGRWIG